MRPGAVGDRQGAAGEALSEADLDRVLGRRREWLEEQLERHLPIPPECPERLAEAIRYALMGGGKRLRPVLCSLVCEGLGGVLDDAAPAAVALEMLHTYSLVHDDLPAMDDDDLRRGRATCHKVYGEALAILVGDALLTSAFEVLSGARLAAAEQVAALAKASGAIGMVGGQVLDLEAGDRLPGLKGVLDVHARKTAALFGAGASLGALSAAAGPEVVERAQAFGIALGMAFQATDDVLDVTADAATLGKTPGKDAVLERDSLVALLGLEGALARAAAATAEARREALGLGLPENHPLVALVSRLESRTH